jgi:hypothetical protein
MNAVALCYQPPCDQPEGTELCGIEGFVVDCDDPLLEQLNEDACPPTSYNSWVIDTGTEIMDGISKALAKHYVGLICDPPDPNFEVVVPLDLSATFDAGAPSFAPAGAGAQPEGQAALNRALATQAAAYQALLPTLEKLQGAEQAGSNLGLMLQAEKTIAYGELAQAAGQEMLDAVDLIEADLAAEGHLEVVYEIATPLAAMESELSPADRNYLYSFGVSDTAIELGQQHLASFEVPPEVSRRALLEAVRGNVEAMDAALTVMVSQATQVRDENAAHALRLGPLASVSGQATAGVGLPVTLTASAEYRDPGATLTYAWDADLDGAFDDGDATTLEFIPSAPGLALVGVRVSDAEGRADVAYHRVNVSVTNVPPSIASTTPSNLAPFADIGESVDLAVEASDLDGDELGYRWYVDGSLVATVPTISFVMPDEEMHVIRVVVSDSNAYTLDAETRFTIRSSKWEGQTGEGGQGAGGGETSGSGANGAGGASTGDANDGGGSCDCRTPAKTSSNWLGLLASGALALSGALRRRANKPGREGGKS